ncbi:MAG: LURP-one-related/scramblase family protein, partial [Nitrososphaerales archaeon]
NCGKPTTASAASTPVNSTQTFGPATNDPQSLLEARDVIMKKKIMSLREHYDFENPNGRQLGEGAGNFFQVPAKFIVLASQNSPANPGQEIMHIDGKILSLRHEFKLYDANGQELGSIKKKIAKLIGQEYWLELNGQELMRIYGNFTAHEYLMSINGQPVAQVHKKWVSIRDQFGVSITGNVDPRLVLGSVIVVEHLEVTQRDNNSGFRIGI